jgi:hypothetical protein
VIDSEDARSTSVTAAIVDAAPPRTLDFDALYRDARDDVYAYAATLLRDRAAADDVAAAAFEVAAGVALIAPAVALPLGLIAAPAAGVGRVLGRRRRERALELA